MPIFVCAQGAVVGNKTVKREAAELFLQSPAKGKRSASVHLVIKPVLLHREIIIKLQL